MRALVRAERGELGFEVDVKGVLVGVCRVRTGADVIEVGLGSCLRALEMAEGRRSMNAMIRNVEIGDEEWGLE